MSQTDIVKILANAYLDDFKVTDLREPDPADVATLFAQL